MRGDSVAVYKSFPELDPKNYDGDGEKELNKTITWPELMSTTMIDSEIPQLRPAEESHMEDKRR